MKNKIKIQFVCICLLNVLSIFRAVSQEDLFRFRNYNVEDGLSSNTVRCILQDSYGFMWFGTENGLSRFDGHSFKNFMTVSGDSTSAGNNRIYALYEDSVRNLWVGTDKGVYIYDFEMERFAFFSKKTSSGITIQSRITNIKKDKCQNIWFSTCMQGIFQYSREKDELSNYAVKPDSPGASSSNAVSSLYIDHNNTVWATSQKEGEEIKRYDPASDRFVPLPLRTEKDNSHHQIDAMTEDSEHNFWTGARKHGLCRLDRNTGTVQSFPLSGTGGDIQHIHEITEYQPGLLLVGSDDGLSVFNTHACKSNLTAVSNFNSTSSDKFVYPIYKDSEGGLWVGTYYGGVNYAPPVKKGITGYSRRNYKNFAGGNIISCFCEDASGNIWTGSNDGWLSCFDPQKKVFKNYMPDKNRNSLSYHNIHALYCDNDKIWIGTYSGGLNVLDLKTDRFKHSYAVNNDTGSLYGNSVYAIYKDRNDLWTGTVSGICLYCQEKDNFIRMKDTDAAVVDIISDSDSSLWFATMGAGLLRYSKESREWRHYLHEPDNAASIPHNQINSLHIDAEGKFWLGTNNGLALYNRENNSFSTIHLDVGNTVNYVRNINGKLWLTTNSGLVCYTLSDKTVKTFSKNDGLQSNQFNMKAGLLSSSGCLYLGTTNGFNMVNPDDLSENSNIPQVYITNFQIFNQDLKIDGQGLLTRSLLYTKQIELPYRTSVFSVEYTAISYNAPSKNRYKYMLEGFDQNWNTVENRRKATYTNLPPGKYVFRVKGSNSNGVWNSQGTCLTIIIRPPFWHTPLANYLYILFALGMLFYIMFLTGRREEKKHRKQMQQLQSEKEKELYDAKINFFTLVAHEIRTPVSLIIATLEKIMDSVKSLPDTVQDSLHIINHNSQRLLSLVNQLLDFRKAEEKSFLINFALHNIYGLLKNLYDRFKPVMEQQNIAFSLDMENREISAVADAEALTTIVSNLLTNALKFTKDSIKISATSSREHIYIKVIDNGEGIAKENIRKIFQPFFQVTQNCKSGTGTGIGLSLVKFLVDAHDGKIEIDSIPGKGTAFTVILPNTQTGYVPASSQDSSDKKTFSFPERFGTEKTAGMTADHTDKPVLLIVEDDSDVRKFLHDSLCPEYRIIEAVNGEDGLSQLNKQLVDIIISDIMMPVMDGITFTGKVKENLQFSHIPLILLSAKIDKNSKIEGINTGADAYIEKPFSLQILTAQIQNLVESRKKLRKKFSELSFVSQNSVVGNKADEQFLDRVHKIIDLNIANQDFSIDMLAEEVCISRSGLFSKIRLLAGITPNELIQLIRLKKAAQLLLTREYRINEICYMVGFNNPSYFSKCFQKLFGVLPKDFANQGQSQHKSPTNPDIFTKNR
jgi:signal transduction histidine kinase/ligand-binding sensor domain-containing protein/DNA-binding response OmpR family regulator